MMTDSNSTNDKALALPSLSDVDELHDFLDQPTLHIAEVLTGILASGKSDYLLSAGRLAQAATRRRLLEQFGRELEGFREKGKIKEDYFATNNSRASFIELLQFIDNEAPDKERFNAMKSVFFSTVAKDADEIKEQLGYQLLQICKRLSSMDLLVLKGCYEAYLENDEAYHSINSYMEWRNTVSSLIGAHLPPELVSNSDERLVENGLLTSRVYSDLSGIRKGRNFRLTELGLALCKYISEWPETDLRDDDDDEL